MSESFGGSRSSSSRRNAAGMSATKGSNMSGTRGREGGLLGGTAGRAQTAQGSPLAGVGGGAPRGRPMSAPRMRPGTLFGSNAGSSPADAKARVEESRQLKEAGLWGREDYVPMELPAYWSVATYGEPFNDPRRALAASQQPGSSSGGNSGPATQQILNLRKSLMDGKRYFSRTDLSPLPDGSDAEPLKEADRVMLLQRLMPYTRVHAYRNMWDRDTKAKDFVPWTQLVWDKLDVHFWNRNRDLAIRLAVQKLENMMRRHLKYASERRCEGARAPSSSPKEILREAFWKVDPQKTGLISLAQFLQVWQNVLMLMQFDDVETRMVTGKTRMALVPTSRFIFDQNMCAGLFVRFGFDKEGLMPYKVFSQALVAAPSRLLGEELVLDKKDQGRHGISDEADISYIEGGAKVIYPKCEGGVFPPNGFDRRLAERSRLVPSAHMWLEHVYGYAGMDVKATNIFYTHQTTETNTEIVYYTGMVGVVFNKEQWGQGKPSQKFFFGHDNDIECIAIHPGRRFVATGQQKATGPTNVPYVCIWDVETCNQLQRLDHDIKERGVIAVGFSGNVNGAENKKGGDIIVTITADDKHSIHVWRWMQLDNVFAKAVNIPGWCLNPDKKLGFLKSAGYYYQNPDVFEDGSSRRVTSHDGATASAAFNRNENKKLKEWAEEPTEEEVEKYMDMDHALLNRARNVDLRINTAWEEGLRVQGVGAGDKGVGFGKTLKEDVLTTATAKADKSCSLLYDAPGCNGTPPMVYGIVWNPRKPQDGGRGSEFATYGVKHLKTWIVSDQPLNRGGFQDPNNWVGTSASFHKEKIDNVLSALYVPALHYMASPGDSCLLTGFASGQIGLWIPPFPTQAGATYQLMRMFDAHDPGGKIRLNDGSQVHGGVRVLRLRAPRDIGAGTPEHRVLSGGSDGHCMQWKLAAPEGKNKEGTPMRGVNLVRLAAKDETMGPNRFSIGVDPKSPAMIVGLDCIISKPDEFVAGTSDCDIWEVDKDPRVLVEGQEEDVFTLATHSTKPNIFATTSNSGVVRIYDTQQFDVIKSANVGFPITGAAFSNEPYSASAYKDPNKTGIHLALGSQGLYTKGDWHKIAIVDADTLQPLKLLKEPTGQPGEIKYSPPGGPAILAAGSQDMRIYLYSVKHDYQYIGRCSGHSSTVLHLDWTLPISLPGHKLHGEMLLMAADASSNIMYWNPKNARAVTQNQRDAAMYTDTCKLGFNVMGIWPDDSGPDDINAVCRSKRGGPTYKQVAEGATASDRAAAVDLAREEDSADGVPGAGYLVAADDFSTISLMNYPVVWDDAPCKLFFGHASHIMCVRFNCDDRLVVSAGGHDRGLYQWRTIGINKDDAAEDKIIMAARRALLKNRTAGDPIFDPDVEWGPKDGVDGKIVGPSKTVRQSRAFTSGGSPGASASFPPNDVALQRPPRTPPPQQDSNYSFDASFDAPAAVRRSANGASGGAGATSGTPTPRPGTSAGGADSSRPATPTSGTPGADSRPGTATGGTPGTSSRSATPTGGTPGASPRPGTATGGTGTASGSTTPRAMTPAGMQGGGNGTTAPRPGTPGSGTTTLRPGTPAEGGAAASGGSSLFNSGSVGAEDSGSQTAARGAAAGGGGSRPRSAQVSPGGVAPRGLDSGSPLVSGDISGLSSNLDGQPGKAPSGRPTSAAPANSRLGTATGTAGGAGGTPTGGRPGTATGTPTAPGSRPGTANGTAAGGGDNNAKSGRAAGDSGLFSSDGVGGEDSF